MRLRKLGRDTRGATAIEYGLIIALIFVSITVAVHNVANRTITMWNNVASTMSNAAPDN